jgi:hypothetical protein
MKQENNENNMIIEKNNKIIEEMNEKNKKKWKNN